jgi:hypothetical protein
MGGEYWRYGTAFARTGAAKETADQPSATHSATIAAQAGAAPIALQGLVPARGRLHLVALVREDARERVTDGGLVVCDQHPHRQVSPERPTAAQGSAAVAYVLGKRAQPPRQA